MSHNPKPGEPLTQNLQLQLQKVKPAPPTQEEVLAEARRYFSPVGKPAVKRSNPQKPNENGDKNCGQGDSSPDPQPNTPCKERSTMPNQTPSFNVNTPPTAPSSLTPEDRAEMRAFANMIASAVNPQSQPKEPSYFQKFDGVSVGEKLVTATGYGVITVGTFAGCCGVAKLMGVVK